MSILCAIGLHKFKQLRVEGFTGEHDWFARVWGNALIVDACERCQKHRYNAAYLPSPQAQEVDDMELSMPKSSATASPDAKNALGGIEVAKSIQSRSTGFKTARPSTEGR